MKSTITSGKAAALAAPPPVSTGTYKAVPHSVIIDGILGNLDKEGFDVVAEDYRTAYDGKLVIGHFKLGLGLDKDLNFEIAFMNSYNKTRRAIIIAGSKVAVCSNGHIFGDLQFGSLKRKHVGTVLDDINTFIPEMIKSATSTFQKLIVQKNNMMEIVLTPAQQNELVGGLFLQEDLVTARQLVVIRQEMRHPSYDYKTGGNTLWDVYNHVTFSMRNSHPANWFTVHGKLNKHVSDKFSI